MNDLAELIAEAQAIEYPQTYTAEPGAYVRTTITHSRGGYRVCIEGGSFSNKGRGPDLETAFRAALAQVEAHRPVAARAVAEIEERRAAREARGRL